MASAYGIARIDRQRKSRHSDQTDNPDRQLDHARLRNAVMQAIID